MGWNSSCPSQFQSQLPLPAGAEWKLVSGVPGVALQMAALVPEQTTDPPLTQAPVPTEQAPPSAIPCDEGVDGAAHAAGPEGEDASGC